MTIKDIYETVYYCTTLTLRVFGEINNEDDAINNYTDTIATKDNIQDFLGLSIMCIVATSKDNLLIELA